MTTALDAIAQIINTTDGGQYGKVRAYAQTADGVRVLRLSAKSVSAGKIAFERAAKRLPGYFDAEYTVPTVYEIRVRNTAYRHIDKATGGYRDERTGDIVVTCTSSEETTRREVAAASAYAARIAHLNADHAQAILDGQNAEENNVTIAATKVTHYEVVWGDDEADRIVYTDEHDGTFLSSTAEHRATRKFLEIMGNGVDCGLFVNGALDCGKNVTDGPDRRPAALDDPELYARWVAGEVDEHGKLLGAQDAAVVVEHKTRTVLDSYQSEIYKTKSNGSGGRWKSSEASTALCACGWRWNAGARSEARMAARSHRSEVVA